MMMRSAYARRRDGAPVRWNRGAEFASVTPRQPWRAFMRGLDGLITNVRPRRRTTFAPRWAANDLIDARTFMGTSSTLLKVILDNVAGVSGIPRPGLRAGAAGAGPAAGRVDFVRGIRHSGSGTAPLRPNRGIR